MNGLHLGSFESSGRELPSQIEENSQRNTQAEAQNSKECLSKCRVLILQQSEAFVRWHAAGCKRRS